MEYWTAIWQSILLGTVQGLTEFLPVSSSGHLELLHRLLGADFGGNTLFVDIVLHLGTLISVVIVLRKEIIMLFRKPFRWLYMIVAATVPAGIVGLLFHKEIESLMSGVYGISFLAVFFAITAILLVLTEYAIQRQKCRSAFGWKHSLSMGVAQAFALFPGISRSGATIAAGIISGAEKREVVRFSFLMSVPIILASVFLSTIDIIRAPAALTQLGGAGCVGLAVGFVSSAVSGLFAIKAMLRIVQRSNYKWFSLYLILLSLGCTLVSCGNFFS